MSERVLDKVMDIADQLREQAAEAEKIGKLTDQTTKAMKAVGSIRLLQPAKHGGLEVHPREFAETVMATASLDPAAGWITGVVGVHPYQLAYADPRVGEEVWAEDIDTWVASPYAPQGVAKPVDGGYIFNGRWQFSSGTDQCEWIILGAMLGDVDGKPVMPPAMLHMILPRKDYEIVEDSWNVVGLRGTGSKDIIVRDAFVPQYRMMDANEVMDGTAQRKAGMTETLYLMPWSTMFPLGITAAVVGIAEGALAAHLDYQRDRVGAAGTTRTSCTPSARPPRTSTPPARNSWPMSTVSTTSSSPVRKCPSRTAPPVAVRRCARRGAPSWRSIRSSPARAATRCGWTNRCSATGATPTPGSRTQFMCPARSSTLPR
jgi:3-hydroxy-9,10-secoandrosta-1,3,5(10)-triene-9,17-dione monooxygenase